MLATSRWHDSASPDLDLRSPQGCESPRSRLAEQRDFGTKGRPRPAAHLQSDRSRGAETSARRPESGRFDSPCRQDRAQFRAFLDQFANLYRSNENARDSGRPEGSAFRWNGIRPAVVRRLRGRRSLPTLTVALRCHSRPGRVHLIERRDKFWQREEPSVDCVLRRQSRRTTRCKRVSRAQPAALASPGDRHTVRVVIRVERCSMASRRTTSRFRWNRT